MRRFRLMTPIVALGATLALASSASAFGGGTHMGGAGGGLGAGGLQTGRSVAVGNAGSNAAVGGIGGAHGTGMTMNGNRGAGFRNHGGRGGYGGYGFGGFGLDDGYYDTGYGYDYGYPDDGAIYGYGYGDQGLGYDAPVQTGRSVAEPSSTCSTPIKVCTLRHASMVGESCSCKVSGGRSGGHVTP